MFYIVITAAAAAHLLIETLISARSENASPLCCTASGTCIKSRDRSFEYARDLQIYECVFTTAVTCRSASMRTVVDTARRSMASKGGDITVSSAVCKTFLLIQILQTGNFATGYNF
jgi:hypothetical protein